MADFWWMKTATGANFEVKATSISPAITINYKMQELSSRRLRSIDRGVQSDRYATKIRFEGATEYIESLAKVLNDLRLNGSPVVMGDIESNVAPFGDHVDYSGDVETLVQKYGKIESGKRNVLSLTVEFLATGLVFNNDAQIPAGLGCLSHRFAKIKEWNTHINETVFGNNYFVDRTADRYIFEGTYILTTEENSQLHNYWRTQRGEIFTALESDFGVTEMFGEDFEGETSHSVVFLDIEYSPISPQYREVTIKLVKAD